MSAPLTTLRNRPVERYRFDGFAEYVLTKRGRENVALGLIAFACIGGIILAGRL